jgi:hypothetical protein
MRKMRLGGDGFTYSVTLSEAKGTMPVFGPFASLRVTLWSEPESAKVVR